MSQEIYFLAQNLRSIGTAIDDILPQTKWLNNHKAQVVSLIATLGSRNDLTIAKLNWASSIIIAVKVGSDGI